MVVVASWLAVACGSESVGADGQDTGSSDGGETTIDPGSGGMTGALPSSTGTSGGTTDTSPTTAASTTTVDPDSSGGGSTTPDPDSSADSIGFIPEPETSGNTPQPNGAECFGSDDCESGFCYEFFNGAVCSECLEDADCAMGTCALDFDVGYAVCTMGELGVQCDSDRGCMGELVCATVFGEPGGQGPSFERCSECDTDTPCGEGTTCTPVLEGSLFDSYLGCAAPGTVALGGGCPVLDGVGDGAVCASGFCGTDSIFMGNVDVGVCSECLVDTDCAEGLVCSPPDIGMMGITAGACG
jgi:Cys-rich repeat protein